MSSWVALAVILVTHLLPQPALPRSLSVLRQPPFRLQARIHSDSTQILSSMVSGSKTKQIDAGPCKVMEWPCMQRAESYISYLGIYQPAIFSCGSMLPLCKGHHEKASGVRACVYWYSSIPYPFSSPTHQHSAHHPSRHPTKGNRPVRSLVSASPK